MCVDKYYIVTCQLSDNLRLVGILPVAPPTCVAFLDNTSGGYEADRLHWTVVASHVDLAFRH